MRTALAALLMAIASAAWGQVQAPDTARDPAVELRLKALAEELRCLVCQNQTIADSNAGLAIDLRNQIRAQITQGRSDAEIRDYMVARYGDFVLYRPPLRATTALLWLGPLIMIVIGVIALVVVVRRRGAQAPGGAPAPKRRKEIEALLSGKD